MSIASQVLKVRKKRKEELDAKRKQENIQQQSQANQQAAQAAESAKQQTMSVKIQTESQMKQLEFDLELQECKRSLLKSMLLEMQSNLNNQSQAQKITLQAQKENTKEDRRSKDSKASVTTIKTNSAKKARFRSY